ncbi:MAG: hypothetical protein V4505_13655 [Pseudomonadota bacterium]
MAMAPRPAGLPVAGWARRALAGRCLLPVALLLGAHQLPAAAAAPPPAMPPALTRAVDALIGVMSDGYAKAGRPRLLQTVQLGGQDYLEADRYTLVSFTLEFLDQGNDYNQYLAVFTPAAQPEGAPARYRLVNTLAIGGMHWREVDVAQLRYTPGRLEFPAMEFRESDALCCRSKASRAIFSLNRLGLRETGPTGGPLR